MKPPRIEIIDALRGFAVVLMVIHHLLFDLVEFLGAPAWLFSNPVFDVLHYVFAGLFIFLSGVSSRFSRSNIKRGLKVILIALAITLVTYLLELATKMPLTIRFGVLHLLGFCMLLYGLARRAIDGIPRRAALVLYILLLVGSALAVRLVAVRSGWLWPLGLIAEGFSSADYFPILPWVFVFLSGTWAGYYVFERKLPDWFYEKRVPVFPAVGRKALIIYVVHQPVLYGLVFLIGWLANVI